MSKTNKTEHNKRRVIEALTKTMGIVTRACEMAEISRTQFYHWCKTDPDFAEQVKSIEDIALDYAESKLFENIKSKRETSIIFYLKTKGRKRGYNEKIEVENTHKGGVQIGFSDKKKKNKG